MEVNTAKVKWRHGEWTSFAFIGFNRTVDFSNVFLLDGTKLSICASHKSLKVNYACDDKRDPKPSSRYEASVVDPPLAPPPPPPPPPPAPAVGVYVESSTRFPARPSTSVPAVASQPSDSASSSTDAAATIFPPTELGHFLAMSQFLDKYVGPEVSVFCFGGFCFMLGFALFC